MTRVGGRGRKGEQFLHRIREVTYLYAQNDRARARLSAFARQHVGLSSLFDDQHVLGTLLSHFSQWGRCADLPPMLLVSV